MVGLKHSCTPLFHRLVVYPPKRNHVGVGGSHSRRSHLEAPCSPPGLYRGRSARLHTCNRSTTSVAQSKTAKRTGQTSLDSSSISTNPRMTFRAVIVWRSSKAPALT